MQPSRTLPAVGLGLGLCLFWSASQGATLAVPSQFPAIQSAIDSAGAGDVISVSPGTYHECLNFKGKAISVVSASGPSGTTLAAGPAVGINGPFNCVLYFDSNETHQAVVSGFTIDIADGGISALGASPTITDNVFVSSGADLSGAVGANDSNLVFQRNNLSGLTEQSNFPVTLIGIVGHSSVSIKDNVFANNHTNGAAISLTVYSNSSPDVSNNTFVGNDMALEIMYTNPPPTATRYRNNIIFGNKVGVHVPTLYVPPSIQNNLVYGNTTNYLETPDQTGENGNISVDPKLGGLEFLDIHPDTASPVIDAGVNAAVDSGARDIYSGTRIRAGTSGKPLVDIGAAEYAGVPPDVSVAPSADFVLVGQPLTISWSSTYATACSAKGAWSGPLALSGSQTVVPAAGLPKYSVVCANAAAARGRSFYVRVYAPPTVTLSASPSVTMANYPSVITWSSSDTTSCVKSGAWSGPAATSGSESVVSTTVGKFTYGLTCTGPDGTGAGTVIVTVPPAPTITFTSSSTYIAPGQTFSLMWKTTDASICNGGFSPGTGIVDTSGSMVIGPLPPEQQGWTSIRYDLYCNGPGGSASSSVYVTPIQPSPSLTEFVSIASPTIYDVTEPGQIPLGGGLDGHGYSYPAIAPIPWLGKNVSLGSGGKPNGASRTTVPLDPQRLSSLSIVATGVNGSQVNQVFVVTYADGTQASFTQSLSDWGAPKQFAGETNMLPFYYRITPTGNRQSGTWRTYSYNFNLDSSKTVRSLTLPPNRNVIVLDIAETAPAQPKSIDLSGVYNVTAFATTDHPAVGRGIDGHGYALSGDLIGRSLWWSGEPFALGVPLQVDAISNAVIPLPNAPANRVTVLATGVNGAQPNQSFLVTYSDGGTTEFHPSISEWGKSSNYAGESVAASTAYRITPTGTQQTGAWRVYAYTFDVYAGTPLKSLTLPKNSSVVILAVNVDEFF